MHIWWYSNQYRRSAVTLIPSYYLPLHLISPHPIPSYLIQSHTILRFPIPSYLIQSHTILRFPILSYPIQSYSIQSYPILTHPILSYPIPIRAVYCRTFLSVVQRCRQVHALPHCLANQWCTLVASLYCFLPYVMNVLSLVVGVCMPHIGGLVGVNMHNMWCCKPNIAHFHACRSTNMRRADHCD